MTTTLGPSQFELEENHLKPDTEISNNLEEENCIYD